VHRQILAAVAAILCSAGVATAGGPVPVPSWAYSFVPTHKEKVLLGTGNIETGDFRLFVEVANSAQSDIIVLDSPGGRIDEALRIAH
jgi:hypothetical protein